MFKDNNPLYSLLHLPAFACILSCIWILMLADFVTMTNELCQVTVDSECGNVLSIYIYYRINDNQPVVINVGSASVYIMIGIFNNHKSSLQIFWCSHGYRKQPNMVKSVGNCRFMHCSSLMARETWISEIKTALNFNRKGGKEKMKEINKNLGVNSLFDC